MIREYENAVVIADRSEAGRLLSAPVTRRAIGYVISIGSPAERPAANFHRVPRRLRLEFDDDVGVTGPSLEDIKELVAFARAVDFSHGQVLIHCQAGISRSTAAAVILLTVHAGAAALQQVAAHVRTIRPQARPNRQMLMHADTVLGLNGLLESLQLTA